MKVKLEFNLPEEHTEFNNCITGTTYKTIIREYDSFLRSKLKYGDDDLSDDAIKAYEDARTLLWKLIEEFNVTLENE